MGRIAIPEVDLSSAEITKEYLLATSKILEYAMQNITYLPFFDLKIFSMIFETP